MNWHLYDTSNGGALSVADISDVDYKNAAFSRSAVIAARCGAAYTPTGEWDDYYGFWRGVFYAPDGTTSATVTVGVDDSVQAWAVNGVAQAGTCSFGYCTFTLPALNVAGLNAIAFKTYDHNGGACCAFTATLTLALAGGGAVTMGSSPSTLPTYSLPSGCDQLVSEDCSCGWINANDYVCGWKTLFSPERALWTNPRFVIPGSEVPYAVSDELSLMFELKAPQFPPAGTGWRSILKWGGGTEQSQPGLLLNSAMTLSVAMVGAWPDLLQTTLVDLAPYVYYNWYFNLAITVKGATVRVYVDGELRHTWVRPKGPLPLTTSWELNVPYVLHHFATWNQDVFMRRLQWKAREATQAELRLACGSLCAAGAFTIGDEPLGDASPSSVEGWGFVAPAMAAGVVVVLVAVVVVRARRRRRRSQAEEVTVEEPQPQASEEKAKETEETKTAAAGKALGRSGLAFGLSMTRSLSKRKGYEVQGESSSDEVEVEVAVEVPAEVPAQEEDEQQGAAVQA